MADYYSILASCNAIRAAYNSGDVDRMLSQFAPAFTLIAPGLGTVEGEASGACLREQAAALFRTHQVYCVQSVPYVTSFDRTAWVWGQERFRLTRRDNGDVFYDSLKVTRVWTLQSDGSWKITFQMQEPDAADARNFAACGLEQDAGIA